MIYFMQSIDGGPVKIGYTVDLTARQLRLERLYGTPLVVLATMAGGQVEEADIHARFADLRLGRTEQFRPGEDLMAFIRRPLLASANPDAVEAMPTPGKQGELVRLYVETAEIIKQAASERQMSIGAFCDKFLRPCVEQAHLDHIKEEARRLGGKAE